MKNKITNNENCSKQIICLFGDLFIFTHVAVLCKCFIMFIIYVYTFSFYSLLKFALEFQSLTIITLKWYEIAYMR